MRNSDYIEAVDNSDYITDFPGGGYGRPPPPPARPADVCAYAGDAAAGQSF